MEAWLECPAVEIRLKHRYTKELRLQNTWDLFSLRNQDRPSQVGPSISEHIKESNLVYLMVVTWTQETTFWAFARMHEAVHYPEREKWKLANILEVENVNDLKYSVFVVPGYVQHASAGLNIGTTCRIPRMEYQKGWTLILCCICLWNTVSMGSLATTKWLEKKRDQ